jgi:hypothetical protein
MDPPNKSPITSFPRPVYCCEINLRLFPKQCKEQSQDDADEDGGNNGKVESEILFSNDDISGKSTHPWNFFSKEQKKTNQDNKDTQKNEHLA